MTARTEPTLGDDLLEVFEGEEQYGDALSLSGGAGGDDWIDGVDGVSGYTAVGDAFELFGTARGGNDTISGGAYVYDEGSSPLDLFYNAGEDGTLLAGDGYSMWDASRGGDDRISSDENSVNWLLGDAFWGAERARGGNDEIYGSWADNGDALNIIAGDMFLFGDGYDLGGDTSLLVDEDLDPTAVRGGDDDIVAGGAEAEYGEAMAINLVMGDGYALGDSSRGGDDEISSGEVWAYEGGVMALNAFMGDGYALGGNARGGSDAIYGADLEVEYGDGQAINVIAGDAFFLAGGRAGSDYLEGGDADVWGGFSDDATTESVEDIEYADVINVMAGDGFAYAMSPSLGRDEMHGGSGDGDAWVVNLMIGDVGLDPDVLEELGGLIGGGLIGGGGNNITAALADDEFSLDSSPASFAKDELYGGDWQATNVMAGDADYMVSGSKGGADLLVAGQGWSTTNILIGDAYYMAGDTQGGRDTLVGGAGNDDMWGDAQEMAEGARGGRDTFVITQPGGIDTIHDFSLLQRDRIDLSALASWEGDIRVAADLSEDFGSFQDMMRSERVQEYEGGTIIDLTSEFQEFEVEGRGDFLYIVGIPPEELTAGMFSF